MKEQIRCPWPAGKALDTQYHDHEWGVPLHDDQKLFEFLVLDAFQAGLSWSTILNKRENFRQALDGFNPQIIARYSEDKVAELMNNPGIIRNGLKIRATITNAQYFLKVQEEFGSFDRYIWQFTNHQTKTNAWNSLKEIPASTPESDAMSKDLKKRGFKFVGSTICYAFMQAAGMVNDHLVTCFRYEQVMEK
ncbi:MAG: DNA-3-methyladenine glycosylase [Bacteroidetes bacterium GWF2_41_31]|nr:MAG: DNA-3-methyladenine glycosylase [Bacteroidetes bacterium GWF2_41_31]OFZ07782.1 MAG: DNA-3-methyladenine glycosylase [Bacteroidetes bacterium RIFOXYB12_FULL_41_6]